MKKHRIIFVKIIQLSAYWPLLILFKVFLNFRVRGIDNLEKADNTFILAVNHVSYLDPVSAYISIPFHLRYFPLFFMASDYFYKKLFFYRFIGAIRAREGRDLGLSSKPFIDILANGKSIAIFPEGGIKRDKKRRPRRGISYVAAKSNKLILPLKIESNLDGSVSVLGGKIFDLLTRKHWVRMVFGTPFRIEETIGKTPVSLSELRHASEIVFKRIKVTK